jgi:hypothetical protein
MVPHVLPFVIVEVREYLDQRGHSPFAAWSDRLSRVAAALARIQLGNFSNTKGVGGVFTSTGLILARAIGSTLAKMGTCSQSL